MLSLRLEINGRPVCADVEDHQLLVDFLHANNLTGTKLSCQMQVCGACTVLLNGKPVSSCSTLVAEADGGVVETIEGLGDGETLHPVQQAFLDHFAFQCGFCTPGMILAAKALLETIPDPTTEEIVQWMDGNICRCTGYLGVMRAIRAVILQGAEGLEHQGHG